MGDFDLVSIHFCKKIACLLFDDLVKSFYKGFRLRIGDDVEVVEIFYFLLVAVAKIGYEFVDVIGNDEFDVFFSSGLESENFCCFEGAVSLVSYSISMMEYDGFISERMSRLHPYIVQSQF